MGAIQYSLASHLEWQHLIQFQSVIQVDTTPVFTVKEVLGALSYVDSSTHDTVSFGAVPYRPDPTDQQAPLPQIALDQLRIVHHVLHGWEFPDPVLLVMAASAVNMTQYKKLAQRTCLNKPDRE